MAEGIRVLILDFDGVIADSKKAIYKTYREVCREMGIKFYSSSSEFANNIDGNYKHFFLKLGIKRSDFAKANLIYKKHYSRLEREIKPFPGIKETLAAIRSRGIKIGISSNSFESAIRRILKRHRLEKYIDTVVGGKDIDKLKPSPAQILIAAKRLGAKKSEVAFAGDMEVDMIAGRRAKIAKIIAVTYGYHPKERLKKFGPDDFASRPKDILDIVLAQKSEKS